MAILDFFNPSRAKVLERLGNIANDVKSPVRATLPTPNSGVVSGALNKLNKPLDVAGAAGKALDKSGGIIQTLANPALIRGLGALQAGSGAVNAVNNGLDANNATNMAAGALTVYNPALGAALNTGIEGGKLLATGADKLGLLDSLKPAEQVKTPEFLKAEQAFKQSKAQPSQPFTPTVSIANTAKASQPQDFTNTEKQTIYADAAKNGAANFDTEEQQANGTVKKTNVQLASAAVPSLKSASAPRSAGMPSIAKFAQRAAEGGDNTNAAPSPDQNFDGIAAYKARTGVDLSNVSQWGQPVVKATTPEQAAVLAPEDKYNTRQAALDDAYNSPEAKQYEASLRDREDRRAKGLEVLPIDTDWQTAYEKRTGINVADLKKTPAPNAIISDYKPASQVMETPEEAKARFAQWQAFLASPEGQQQLAQQQATASPNDGIVQVTRGGVDSFEDFRNGGTNAISDYVNGKNALNSALQKNVGDTMTNAEAQQLAVLKESIKDTGDTQRNNADNATEISKANINEAGADRRFDNSAKEKNAMELSIIQDLASGDPAVAARAQRQLDAINKASGAKHVVQMRKVYDDLGQVTGEEPVVVNVNTGQMVGDNKAAPSIPPNHINALKKDPKKYRSFFDEQYGKGAADKVLGAK